MAWAREGARLLLAAAVGFGDSEVHLWQVGQGADTPEAFGRPLTGPGDTVSSVAWARDGSRLLLAAGSYDRRVHLWQVGPGADAPESFGQPLTVPDQDGPVLSVAWARDGSRLLLAAGTGHRGVHLWQVGPGADAPEPFGQPLTGPGDAVAWARDGSRLLLAAGTGFAAGRVQLWQVGQGTDAPEPFGQPLTGRGDAVAWARDGSRLLLATADGRSYAGEVHLWQVEPGADAPEPFGQPLTTPDQDGPVHSVVWARDGSRLLLATGTTSGRVYLWQVGPGADAAEPFGQPITGRGEPVTSVAWARDGSRLLLAAGTGGGRVPLWQVQEVRTVPQLHGYRSDGLGGRAADELDRDSEARAVAELVTARSASPPLAVGLFGDWGEGKSHFLALLGQQVEALSGSPLACHYVRQVRFNAWHYAETSLWASLVAEMFAQLAAPPGGDAGTAQRQLSRLTADLVTQRRLRERLAAARERRDDLQHALSRVDVPWKNLDEDRRRSIIEAAGGELLAEALYRESVSSVRILPAVFRNTWTLMRSAGRRAWLWFALALVASGVLPFGIAWVWPHVSRWLAISGLVFLTQAVRSASSHVKPAWERLKAAQKEVHRAVAGLQAPLQTAADVATAEVAALERELQNLTAAGQLAGLVGERAAAGDYRSQLGLMTQIREDFQRMAVLLAQASRQRAAGDEDAAPRGDEARDELPQIDRIIVYIDDLDRCPPARVMEMLEAIHLLLAVELFVVVVAIDPRWLLRSISAHYRDVLHLHGSAPADVDDNWISTPAQYLEKIFQIVLTLPPVDDTGYARMLDTLISVHTPAPPPGTTSEDGGAHEPSAPHPPEAATASSANPTAQHTAAWDEDLYGPAVEALPVFEQTGPLTFTEEEARLLRLVGPPRLPLTPRSVKRLTNSYGLLTALRQPHHEHDHAERPNPATPNAPTTHYRPYRAGLVLIAALVAFPALGPDLCRHLHQQAGTDPEGTWSDFIAELTPRPHPDHPDTYSNALRSELSPTQAQQWTALHAALRQITAAAAAHQLDLPSRLGPWQPWVIPTARLSFPAGQVVKSLRHSREDRESNL
ncbi:P-loop NTPase fold protein [Streptomyces sp. NPDC048179]|uniref:P-loop NTPase fold protein n=1 Tax=Streptomyces sp. NPDC048179 TaxID=3365506 RepID=UPI003723143F